MPPPTEPAAEAWEAAASAIAPPPSAPHADDDAETTAAAGPSAGPGGAVGVGPGHARRRWGGPTFNGGMPGHRNACRLRLSPHLGPGGGFLHWNVDFRERAFAPPQAEPFLNLGNAHPRNTTTHATTPPVSVCDTRHGTQHVDKSPFRVFLPVLLKTGTHKKAHTKKQPGAAPEHLKWRFVFTF